MSKLNVWFCIALISCFTFVGCGDSGGVVEVEPQTEQEMEDYEADMDASDDYEK